MIMVTYLLKVKLTCEIKCIVYFFNPFMRYGNRNQLLIVMLSAATPLNEEGSCWATVAQRCVCCHFGGSKVCNIYNNNTKYYFASPARQPANAKENKEHTHAQTCPERRERFGFGFVVFAAVVTSSVGYRCACTLACTMMNCELWAQSKFNTNGCWTCAKAKLSESSAERKREIIEKGWSGAHT